MTVWLNVFSPGRTEDTVDGRVLRVFGLQNKDVLWKNKVTELKFNMKNQVRFTDVRNDMFFLYDNQVLFSVCTASLLACIVLKCSNLHKESFID